MELEYLYLKYLWKIPGIRKYKTFLKKLKKALEEIYEEVEFSPLGYWKHGMNPDEFKFSENSIEYTLGYYGPGKEISMSLIADTENIKSLIAIDRGVKQIRKIHNKTLTELLQNTSK